MKSFLKNAVTVSHLMIKSMIKDGDIVIDATCGKGNDTLFLAKLVGENGKVYAFDIQAEAINITSKKLTETNLLDRVTLIQDNHANISLYINEPVSIAMFNLGFLPGSDHNLITQPDTTLTAVMQVLGLLIKGGLITIVFYPGHEGGQEELEIVKNYLTKLSQHEFEVSYITFINQINNPPQLITIQKLGGISS